MIINRYCSKEVQNGTFNSGPLRQKLEMVLFLLLQETSYLPSHFGTTLLQCTTSKLELELSGLASVFYQPFLQNHATLSLTILGEGCMQCCNRDIIKCSCFIKGYILHHALRSSVRGVDTQVNTFAALHVIGRTLKEFYAVSAGIVAKTGRKNKEKAASPRAATMTPSMHQRRKFRIVCLFVFSIQMNCYVFPHKHFKILTSVFFFLLYTSTPN